MEGNKVFWDAEKSGFYEVWYFTINHHPSGAAFWLRSSLLKNPATAPGLSGGLWFARFDASDPSRNLAIRRFFDEQRVSFEPGGLDLAIGSSRYREGDYRAEFEADGHRVKWELTYSPNADDLWLMPELVRKSGIAKADACVPNVDIAIHGSITVDGERYDFDGGPGGQAHHWGLDYAPDWLWGHCNDFEGRPGAWIEALSAKVSDTESTERRATVLHLDTGKRRYSVSTLEQIFTTGAAYENGHWRYVMLDGDAKIEADFHVPPERFVMFPYLSPLGESSSCYNSCLSDLVVRVYKQGPGGWDQIDELTSKGRAAAEFHTRSDQGPKTYLFK